MNTPTTLVIRILKTALNLILTSALIERPLELDEAIVVTTSTIIADDKTEDIDEGGADEATDVVITIDNRVEEGTIEDDNVLKVLEEEAIIILK